MGYNDSINKSELDKAIKKLEKQGKLKEADYLKINKDKIDHLLQPNHIALAFGHWLKSLFKKIQ